MGHGFQLKWATYTSSTEFKQELKAKDRFKDAVMFPFKILTMFSFGVQRYVRCMLVGVRPYGRKGRKKKKTQKMRDKNKYRKKGLIFRT